MGRHAVIFDIDGTLLHSAGVDDAIYRQAVRTVLGDVHLRPTLHDYEHITDTGILSHIFADNNVSAADDLVDAVRSAFVDLLIAHVERHGPFAEMPGANDMLSSLRESPEHAVALATGGWRQSAELKLRSVGIDFSGIPLATSNDHHERTAIMEIALSRLGSGFDSITYFGDGPWDRDACLALGWGFVAVGPELGGLEHFKDMTLCR
jgi:FMN phosphatase YigB (HAD superfamily)